MELGCPEFVELLLWSFDCVLITNNIYIWLGFACCLSNHYYVSQTAKHLLYNSRSPVN